MEKLEKAILFNHEEYIKRLLENRSDTGILKSRESNTVEFKESFNKGNTSKYAKTMAAYANNRGGYIIFGIKDKPRKIVGLQNYNFENMSQEDFSGAINSLFAPAIEWDCGTFTISYSDDKNQTNGQSFKIGWIYTAEATSKPVVAQKAQEGGDRISDGDVFYRYRARTEKIKFAEMNQIIEERIRKEREGLLKMLEVIRESDTANLGIVNYSNGKASTPYGVDVVFERKLVAQVLKKAKYIKEGSFNETDGMPVLKVTGTIDMTEEVPIPDGDPNEIYPYLQKQLIEGLNIKRNELEALIWHFKMKESPKYHLEIRTSRASVVHKFSEHAFTFLREKLRELEQNTDEFEKIRKKYNSRNKI